MAELYIPKANLLQHFDFPEDDRNILKEFNCLIHSHIKHVADGFALVSHLERLAVVAFSVAFLTRHKHIWKEIHLYGAVAVSFAGFAAAARHIE